MILMGLNSGLGNMLRLLLFVNAGSWIAPSPFEGSHRFVGTLSFL
jgi:hypothetical protein